MIELLEFIKKTLVHNDIKYHLAPYPNLSDNDVIVFLSDDNYVKMLNAKEKKLSVWVLVVDTYDKGINTYLFKHKSDAFLHLSNDYDTNDDEMNIFIESGQVVFGEKNRPSTATLYEEEVC